MSISPIPTTRVSDVLVRQRILSQMQSNQLDVLKLQDAISSGRRFTLPSEDPQAAERAISLQRLLERKDQIRENLTTNQSFLTATDTALSDASSTIIAIQGAVQGVIGATSSDQQREAAAQQVDAAIDQLLNVGNRVFRGRYLFAGTRTDTLPFSREGDLVTFDGNERRMTSLSDIDELFESSIDGNSVFGNISQAMQSLADFNPSVSAGTRLDDLRQGAGISRGSVVISDGNSSATIDLSNASTMADVQRILETGFTGAQPSTANRLHVRITATGLSLSLDSGNLTIHEVAGGSVAQQLGILQENPAGLTRVGDDLDPRLTLTTSLDDVLGVRASAVVPLAGGKNDLVINATSRGPSFNNVNVIFASGGTAGSETAVYNAGAGTLTVTIASGVSTANQIRDAINAQVTEFHADLDLREHLNDGSGSVTATSPSAAATTSGGSGVEPNWTNGLKITNGGQTKNVSFNTAVTVQDLINTLNSSGLGLVAEINPGTTSINIRSRLNTSDFSIGENGGSTATHLGVRTLNAATRLSDLNRGLGVHRSTAGADLTIELDDGSSYNIEISSAQTMGDVQAAIQSQTAGKVTATMVDNGNGLRLSVTDSSAASAMTIRTTSDSRAAIDLGLIPEGQSSVVATAAAGVETIGGRDVNPQETSGVFTALARLQDALRGNDVTQINRASAMLDEGLTQVNYMRARLGARQQQLDALSERVESETIDLKSSLSDEIDVDLATVLSDLTARQAAYEASLRMTAQMFQLSLIDFI